jgi:hypothetical protein
MDLLMLAPEIQEEVLFGREVTGLRGVLFLAHVTAWQEQRCMAAMSSSPGCTSGLKGLLVSTGLPAGRTP